MPPEKHSAPVISKEKCYHCGESCQDEVIRFDEKAFCCEGCKLVYDLLRETEMCNYYALNTTPGNNKKAEQQSEKYSYLDEEAIQKKLIQFTDGKQVHISFYIPKMHCSSCIWLLENLHKLNKGVISSTVNFLKKEATIVYMAEQIKLSELVELLAYIGYEPMINLNDLEKKKPKASNKSYIIKIGVAGFAFGNIMMLSFPEYFSFGNFQDQPGLKSFFGYLNLVLSLPVFFYSASGFFESAWKSLRSGYLNIDAPVALAVLVTFIRSSYEIISGTGSGYMDSMAGIVFFMLIGRYFQNITYDTLSFERDYKSYFPVAVATQRGNEPIANKQVSELKKGDRIFIRNDELIPSDAILVSDSTHVDYSFITGESVPVKKVKGELIYAGSRQLGSRIELIVHQETSQSYLTQLWNKDESGKELEKKEKSYVEKINRFFTLLVLLVATAAAVFWLVVDPSRALNAFTSVLIVACPCGLLLTSTFANGNILRILGKHKFYLKNSGVIEKLATADTLVFDKTGTITNGAAIKFLGSKLQPSEIQVLSSLASQSSHPLSRKIASHYATQENLPVQEFQEIKGAGLTGIVAGKRIHLGSSLYVTGRKEQQSGNNGSRVYVSIDNEVKGFFQFENQYREGLSPLIHKLQTGYKLELVSGDNESEKEKLTAVFGSESCLYFNQQPVQKMEHIALLQQQGKKVMMIGDGLNDAGALLKSDVGIAVSDDTNTFSPACDAILDGASFEKLPAFLRLAKAGKKVIVGTFGISLVYNFIGILFSLQGTLSPLVAAILMPISSITIVLVSTISTSLSGKRQGL